MGNKPNVKTVKGMRYHYRDDGTIHREYSPGQWEECTKLDDNVKHAFGVLASTNVILPNLKAATVWF